jgi:uncharacterized protein DUF4105
MSRAVLGTFLVALPAVWGTLALWFQMPGGRAAKWAAVTLWTAVSAAVVIALWQDQFTLALPLFALAFAALLLWWHRLRPSNDRIWAGDVARMTNGTVDGNRVTLHNVRNFEWHTPTDYTPRWETRSYDLDRLVTADMIISYWTPRRAIAHMLISFGFDGAEHVVFSVEIRRERDESYSEIGGFFKDFELSIIAADERDVVRLRTNVRREETYLYRLRLPLPAMRSLFLAYIAEANRLVEVPRFYHTVTVNCTTLVYHMMKRILGRLNFSYRVLFPGYMPEYVYSVGGLDRRHSLEELRATGFISERARKADQSESFSADIRQGVPSL